MLKWQPSQLRSDVLHAEAGRHSYQLSSIDGNGVAPFRLEVFAAEKKGEIAVVEMRPPEGAGGGELNEALSGLYRKAMRGAQRTDEEIRDLFEDLEALEKEQERDRAPQLIDQAVVLQVRRPVGASTPPTHRTTHT